ncbi:hypothetical protein D5F01_LYC00857 [Larimichthys crocea]|uniref:BEN domain-containing protein n=1 Tax=Larimichthys crocea TaxID=215358 RepID=A0A6G0JAG3_LARCR|nr:hypothetical protein D5F01_LYC00857 [Larimichthys crocea]
MPMKLKTVTFSGLLYAKMEADTFYTAAKRPRRVLSKTKQPSPLTRPQTSASTPRARANVRLIKKKAATTVNSVAGSYAGSVQGLLEAEIRALKSRVATVEATRVPDGIRDSFNERLLRVEEAVQEIKECLQRLSPDVAVRALPAEREEEFFRLCQTRPDTYAANVFMALTPFDVYKCWGKNVNWSGTNGKRPLPDNLKERVHQHVSQRFPNLSGDQWQKIRSRINERLRSPRKADPETQRAGFSR